MPADRIRSSPVFGLIPDNLTGEATGKIIVVRGKLIIDADQMIMENNLLNPVIGHASSVGSGNNERRLRICNVDEEGRFGGPERRIVLVAKALKRYGVDTHVVYPRLDSERFAKELMRAGVNSTSLDITRLSKEKNVLCRYILHFFPELYRISNFFRNHNFDLIYVNGSYQFKVALAAKLAGIPFVWHLNDTKMDSIVKIACTHIAKYCASGLILTGKKVYEYYVEGTALEKKPSCELQVPVDTTIFDPAHAVPDARVNGAAGRKIVTVSGINPTKGLEYFIEMASELLSRHEDLYFFVAGAEFSSQRKYFESLKTLQSALRLIDHNFIFAGMIDNVPSFLQSADIFVYTSISEAGPAAVWEAMSMGKAVVTTDVGSVSQYIENGKSGFVVPIKDVKALTEKVELLLGNSSLRLRMGTEARLVAQKYLDLSTVAQRHASFYQRILALSSNG